MRIRAFALAALVAAAGGLAHAQATGQAAPVTGGPAAAPPGAASPGSHGHGHGRGPHGGRHGHGFAMLDSDRDGAISRAEMDAAHQRRMQRFDQADADRDGRLTRDEMRAMRGGHGGHGPRTGGARPGAGPATVPGGAVVPGA